MQIKIVTLADGIQNKNNYSELGLFNTRVMFKHAIVKGYAIPAYNFNNMEQLQAIVLACLETSSPVIIQVSKGAREYADEDMLIGMAQSASKMMRRIAFKEGLSEIPIALHLDHGETFEICKSCIDSGFSSVMIDGSKHSFEENIRLTKEVVDYAHARGVTVEGELGQLKGIEDDVNVEVSNYTDVEQVVRFVQETGVDSLAISIGTSHGAMKFTPEQCTVDENGVLVPKTPLRFDILAEIERRLPGFPIVLHGSSSVIPAHVKTINDNGGKLEDTVGIPAEQLREAAKSAVCKINIDSDGRLAMTAAIRKYMKENPEKFDPRDYFKPARQLIKELYMSKNRDVLGSAGQAKEIMQLIKADEIMCIINANAQDNMKNLIKFFINLEGDVDENAKKAAKVSSRSLIEEESI